MEYYERSLFRYSSMAESDNETISERMAASGTLYLASIADTDSFVRAKVQYTWWRE